MKKEQKPKKWVRQAAILTAMRRVWVRSPMYKAIMDYAKESYVAKNKDGSDSKAHRVKFRCAHCNNLFVEKETRLVETKKGLKKKKVKLIEVDHIDPVINPETGMRGIEEWIERQFIGVEVWDPKVNTVKDVLGKIQILCLECHDTKSNKENERRREVKKKVS